MRRRTIKRFRRLQKRFETLHRLLESNLGNWRHRQFKSRIREMHKLVTILGHPGWYRR